MVEPELEEETDDDEAEAAGTAFSDEAGALSLEGEDFGGI